MGAQVPAAVIMIALARAFELVFDPDRKREPTIMVQPAGAPPPGPFTFDLDLDDPANSRVIVHWKRD